jgi:hypothetical protein
MLPTHYRIELAFKTLEYTITLDRQNPMATVHIRQWIYQPEESGSLVTRLVIKKLGIETTITAIETGKR